MTTEPSDAELAEKVVAELYYLPDGYDDFCALVRECAARLRGKVASGLLLSVENVLVDYIETIEKTGASLYHGRSVLEQVRATLRTQYAKELAATTAQGADNRKE